MKERKGLLGTVEPTVFFVSLIVVGVFLYMGAAYTASVSDFFDSTHAAIVRNFGWFYILLVSFFLGFVIWLLFSRFGNVKLGDDDEKPRYTYFGWFSMLFSAGMGIGLVFWSIGEPMFHFTGPPLAEGGTPVAAERAMSYTFFHWGSIPGPFTLS